MITLNNISKLFGARVLFQDVNLIFNAGERYGLTGANGAGKSTLLKILQGDLEASNGSYSLPRKIGILRQDQFRYDQIKIIDTVLMGNQTLWKAAEEREKLYEQENLSDQLALRLAELENIFAEEGGYTAENEASKLLKGIGIPEEKHSDQMKTLPTDLKFRVLLVQALYGGPEALLLDEPTNYLDLASIEWLEKNLKEYKGCLLVISHDRHFLNAICTHIADLDYENVTVYTGNYDQMVISKIQAREALEKSNKNIEKKTAKLEKFVEKFGAGQRASQVQSRLKEVERLSSERAELKKSNIQRPYISFKQKKPSGERVLLLKNVNKAYKQTNGEKLQVLKNLSLEINKGEKIGLIGNNGLGKTTLAKILASQLKPEEGEIIEGHEVSCGYFPQDYKQEITPGLSALNWLERASKSEDKGLELLRSYLGRMLFSGEEALKRTEKLSGGEGARLILAKLMLEENNFLVLDEPTNHLDLEAVSALSEALTQYPGTAVVVSHDRELIKTFAKRVIVFKEETLEDYPGSYEEYLFSQSKRKTLNSESEQLRQKSAEQRNKKSKAKRKKR